RARAPSGGGGDGDHDGTERALLATDVEAHSAAAPAAVAGAAEHTTLLTKDLANFTLL
ncbi:hypothetical protein HK405_001922, partial [Cladochytrium tenue]